MLIRHSLCWLKPLAHRSGALLQDALVRRRDALERALACYSASKGAPFPLKWIPADADAQASAVPPMHR